MDTKYRLKSIIVIIIMIILTLGMSNISYAINGFGPNKYYVVDEETGGCKQEFKYERDIDGVWVFTHPFYIIKNTNADYSKQGIAQITVKFTDGNERYGTGILIGQNTLFTSSLLLYDEDITNNGYTYLKKKQIEDIQIKFNINNKERILHCNRGSIKTDNEFNSLIDSIETEELNENFYISDKDINKAYAFIELTEPIGLETGVFPIGNMNSDKNKYICTLTDDMILKTSRVSHKENKRSYIIYNEDIDEKYSLGAPALTAVTNDNGGVAYYMIAGINQGKHGGKNLITTIEDKALKVAEDNEYFTEVPDDIELDILESLDSHGHTVYGIKGYNPEGIILDIPSDTNLGAFEKSKYPFSAECLIVVEFIDSNGDYANVGCTGQLVSNNKILTCGHIFTSNENEVQDILKEKRRNKKSGETVYIEADEIYEREMDIINKLRADKQKQIDLKIKTSLDSEFSKKELQILDKIHENHNDTSKEISIAYIPDGKDELDSRYETIYTPDYCRDLLNRENNIIYQINHKYDLEFSKEIEEKPVWEFSGFKDIRIDFMYDTENQSPSVNDIYTVLKDNVYLHKDYTLAGADYDLAVIKVQENLGDKYGWLGLTDQLIDNKRYSLTGYPSNNYKDTVFSHKNLISSIGVIDTNMGITGDKGNLYWYNIDTTKGFSGSGLKTKSLTGYDLRIASIHHGGYKNTGLKVGSIMKKDIIKWILDI